MFLNVAWCFVPTNAVIGTFFGVVNHHVTKKMLFFLFVGDSFCPFLHYMYRGYMYATNVM